MWEECMKDGAKKNVLRLAGHVWAWHVSPCEWSGDARHGGTRAARVPSRGRVTGTRVKGRAGTQG